MTLITKRIFNIIAIVIVFVLAIYLIMLPGENDKHQNNKVCHTVNIPVSGIITGFGGHGIYQWIEIDNLDKSIAVEISKIKLTKGRSKNYADYKVGDSIIKEANSKELIIKRDTNMAVYILSCK